MRGLTGFGFGFVAAPGSDSGGVTAPAQFQFADWSIFDLGTGDGARISITALPSDGGSPITDLQYSADGGAWTSLGGTTIGDYDIGGLVPNETIGVQIRAVNAIGPGPASTNKAVTPTAFPATFTDDQILIIGPVSLVSITRVSGSPVTVSLYDSAFSATGTALFSQLMSALDEVLLDLQFINGIYATVAGALGAELVTNGTFDANVTGWTAQLAGVTVDWVATGGGRLRLTTTSGGGRATQLVSGLSIGQQYTFSGDIPSVTGAAGQSANVRLTTDAAGGTTGEIYSGNAVLVGSTGSWTTTFTAATTSITIALLAGTGIAAQFDNVSMRQGGVVDGSFEVELAA